MKEAVLITGASRGLGRKFAEKYAERGEDIIVVSRSEDQLNNLKDQLEEEHSLEVLVIPMDLSEPDSAHQLFDTIINDRDIFVKTLINNAGFANMGPFVENRDDREADLLQLNMVTPSLLTKYFLEPMLERGTGQILNVASTAAYIPGPFMSTYYASKAYLKSFSEGVAEELRSKNVTVTCVCPGAVDTEFYDEAGITEDTFLTNMLDYMFMGVADPKNVVEYSIRAMERGRTVVIHGWWNWVMFNLMSYLPRIIPRKILARLQGRTFEKYTRS